MEFFRRLIVCVFLFANAPIIAQEVDSLRLLSNLKELAADKYEGRNIGEKGNALARAYVIEQFEAIGLRPIDSTYVSAFTFWSRFKRRRYDGKNIVGWIKGCQYPERYIVVSAHYDHVGIKNGRIYNGADDNASGTCALVELADYFIQYPPQHSIIIVAFDAEEVGLQGAKCFVDEPPVPKDSIILNLNMDMISRNDSSTINICGTHHYPFLKPICRQVTDTSALNVTYGHDGSKKWEQDWTYSSDHGSFHRANIPFLYFGVEDHQDYHKPEDDFENIQPTFYVNAVRMIIAITREMDAQLAQ